MFIFIVVNNNLTSLRNVYKNFNFNSANFIFKLFSNVFYAFKTFLR